LEEALDLSSDRILNERMKALSCFAYIAFELRNIKIRIIKQNV